MFITGSPNPERRRLREVRRTINARAYAPGREERIAKAQAKRERRNIKRKADAFNSAVGQLRAREALECRA